MTPNFSGATLAGKMGLLEIFRRTQVKDEQEAARALAANQVALQEPVAVEEERTIAPTHEYPQGKIEFVLPDMDQFYEVIRDNFHRLDGEAQISKTGIADSVFVEEQTNLVKLSSQRMSFSTKLVHKGYLEPEKQKLIIDLISQKCKVSPKLDITPPDKDHRDFSLGDYYHGTQLHIDLGFPSYEAFKQNAISEWSNKQKAPERTGLSDREYQIKLTKYQEGLRQFESGISDPRTQPVTIYAKRSYYYDHDAGFRISNQDSLKWFIKTYSEFYKLVFEAIYKAEGLPVPNIQIKFKIPEIPVKEPEKEAALIKSDTHASPDKIKKIPKGLRAECTYCGSNYYTAESFECPGCGASVPHFINKEE